MAMAGIGSGDFGPSGGHSLHHASGAVQKGHGSVPNDTRESGPCKGKWGCVGVADVLDVTVQWDVGSKQQGNDFSSGCAVEE
jgi:hypothetical protein